MVYLSYYEEYPIYEPAEGGYYYSGAELVESERLSKRAAKKNMEELIKEAMELTDTGEEIWQYSPKAKTLWQVTKYIGDGRFYVIEKHKGAHTRGRVPYC